jgi:hypothetical protein
MAAFAKLVEELKREADGMSQPAAPVRAGATYLALTDSDALVGGNPFDNVEPHCHLPADAKAALWAACELVLARPGGFADALAWLDENYSELAILERLLRDSERICRSQLWQLRRGLGCCDTFPRRKALLAGRRELDPARRLALLREFWSVPEIGGVPADFANELIEHPEKVREWVVQLTVQTALLSGWRIEGDKIATRNAGNEKNVVDAGNVELVWRWLDEQIRQRIRHIKEERRERDAERREQAKDRGGRLRQAVRDVVETGMPAGRDERMHARRVVLLACLLSYQHELKLPGEFCTWQWESNGSLFASLVGGEYVPGRETVLFNPAHTTGEPFGPGSVNIDVEGFTALVGRAVKVCRPSNAGAAFLSAMELDPNAKAAWEQTRAKLQAYAKALHTANEGSADELRRKLEDMAEAMREGLRASGDELAAQGFTPPATIEDWEHLARIVEIPLETIRTGNLTAREIHACALAWADRQKIKAKLTAIANPPTSTKPTATYTIAAVLELAGVSDSTLTRYAKRAGVQTPQRGKRNHRYSADEVRAILQAIIDNTSERAMKERCREALDGLPKPN